jgi:hypothetical protein
MAEEAKFVVLGKMGGQSAGGAPGQNFDPADVARIAALEAEVAELRTAIEELRA